jgi:hypothetical protein
MTRTSKSLYAQCRGELEREKKLLDEQFKPLMQLKGAIAVRRIRREVDDFAANMHIDGLQVHWRLPYDEKHIDVTFRYKFVRLAFVIDLYSYPFKPPTMIFVDNDINILSLAGKHVYLGFDPLAPIRTGDKTSMKVSDYIVKRFGCKRPLCSLEMAPLKNMYHEWSPAMRLKDTFECLFNLYTTYTFIRDNLLQTETTPPCIHRHKRSRTSVSTSTSEDRWEA